jgi:uncharacterized protein
MIGWFALSLVGLLIGLVNVVLGGAGGIVYVGLLTAFVNVPPTVAASTSFAIMIPTAIVGTWSHWKSGNVNRRLGFLMLRGGLVGVVVGSIFAGLLTREMYSRTIGVVLLYFSIRMAFAYLKNRGKPDVVQAERRETRKNKYGALYYGLMGGIMSGLVGASGATPTIAGLTLLGCSAVETVGTSVMVVLGFAIVGLGMRMSLGHIEWGIVCALVSGATIGAFVGPKVLVRMDKALLNKILSPILLVVVVGMGVLLLVK